jgi:hypothetical protein
MTCLYTEVMLECQCFHELFTFLVRHGVRRSALLYCMRHEHVLAIGSLCSAVHG